MHYPANAVPPETSEEHSIYPVTSGLLKIPVKPEESTGSHPGPGQWSKGVAAMVIQYHAKDGTRRLEQEKKLMPPLLQSNKEVSDERISLDRDTGYQGGAKISDEGPMPHGKIPPKREIFDPSTNWDDTMDPEDFDKDLSMFGDTPRDASILSETEEWILPPWDTPALEDPPNLSTLTAMTEREPSLEREFRTEAVENLENWNDFRFKIPRTLHDIESLQQALEMTRMDFWIKNPSKTYPVGFFKYKGESYGSQHRRLQWSFCRLWQEFEQDSPPKLFRLPPWMFGFEPCYWKPSSWGFNKKSNAYNQGLVDMAAEKRENGLRGVDYSNWRETLEELDVAPTLEDFASLGTKDEDR